MRALIFGAALYGFGVSLLLGITNPPLEAPDEPGHLAYVNHLIESRTLPNQLDPELTVHGEGHQNPLYYLVGALVVQVVNSGSVIDVVIPEAEISEGVPTTKPLASFETSQDKLAFFVLRALGALLLGLVVVQVGRLAIALGVNPFWPVLFACTLPQFLFVGSTISNDCFTALLAATAILSLVQWHRGHLKVNTKWDCQALIAGAWAGAAFLAKKSALVLIPAAAVLFFAYWKEVRSTVNAGLGTFSLGRSVPLYALGWLILASPVLVRNQILYGDPLANWIETYTLSELTTNRSLISTYFLHAFPMGIASSFVGNFGWLSVQIPMRLVAAYLLLISPGLLASWRKVRQNPRVVYLWAVIMLNVAGLVWYNLSFTQAQGRLLFPALSAIACVWGAGMDTLLRSDAIRLRVAVALASMFISLDTYAIVRNISAYR